ncbi:4-hydroxy-3-methylbut-2-enyl diphosphate reductase [Hirschia baltica]|uniref:4-hydroxy-3-methylbut-2-enyl diphosphate reductase n=1 Tax=Hirschia baltica (strain ATCC 49814 / DSM 5838 / IFAM 1418) TaxID=582402 RepID=C6XRA8_HIRBI|nr:4-hydroxy-3-methylbut-2-enyl diphosphate reductase [Hirschia baltica]ACT58740.1 hydroxymethylbutenyl pyrophosphate reductase [Hirschia baltica ATCC 49814]
METRPKLTISLASPRGFCAGVDRAIHIVEQAIEKWGAPVYVRHEIVHNRHVVSRLENLGAIFVEELDDCPDDRPVVFSAHGVPKAVPAEAARREMTYVDATCPLVSKVHMEAARHAKNGLHTFLIGHAGHPEVVGTMGQTAEGTMTLIETVKDAETVTPTDTENLAYATQTTLSVDDTAEIVATLKQRFPTIAEPAKDDICYATTNRQEAVKALAENIDLMLVIGSPNSSNSQRLVEVAQRGGAKASHLVGAAEEIDWSWFKDVSTLGLSAGASAPETLVQGVIAACRARFDVEVKDVITAKENVVFHAPKWLTKA